MASSRATLKPAFPVAPVMCANTFVYSSTYFSARGRVLHQLHPALQKFVVRIPAVPSLSGFRRSKALFAAETVVQEVRVHE